MENEKIVLDFAEFLENENLYKDTKSRLKETIREDFSRRRTPCVIRTTNGDLETNLGTALLNIVLLRPMIGFFSKIGTEDLYCKTSISQRDLENHFNGIFRKFQTRDGSDFKEVRKVVAATVNELTALSVDTNYSAGESISFYDFLDMSTKSEEARNLFFPVIEDGLQFDEVEAIFKNNGKKIEAMYREHPESDLYPFIVSKTGINIKQLTQSISFNGLKPDIDGSVIPKVMDENFLVGLTNLENYFIGCKGTRKALTTTKIMTKKSGYLTRKLSLLTIDKTHDNNVEDCGTKHFINYVVGSEKKLKMIDGRHYYKLDQRSKTKISDELFTVDAANDKDLVGMTIGLRSPVTCCGEKVCATCYGKYLSEINKDISTGLAGTLKLTEPLTQKLLSAKHLLSTNTDKVNWGEEFLELFSVNMDSIFMNDSEFTLGIPVPTGDDYDEDEDMYTVNTLTFLKDGAKKAVTYTTPLPLLVNPRVISDQAVAEAEDGIITVNSLVYGEDDFIFKFRARNNELIKSLMQILDLIESREHLGITDFHSFVNKFADLLIENDMDNIPSVHTEMIASTLIVDKDKKTHLDFSKEVLPPYTINRVTQSVMDGPLSVSLAFERINDQLADLKTFSKHKSSIMDYLWR